MPAEPFSGLIAGYDPAGNGGQGVAIAEFQAGTCQKLWIETHRHAEAVLRKLEDAGQIAAIGFDTLAAWSTGESGWRAADLWLRRAYSEVCSSVVAPNGLYGSMGLNGMTVLACVRKNCPSIEVTETHPKVLYWALSQAKYDYSTAARSMDADLSRWLATPVVTANEHEWDAVVSVLAAFKGITRQWSHNLFEESLDEAGRLTFPAGPAQYWWPE